MIHRNIFHNDSLQPIEKVRLSPGQTGLICGWGLFTTMRISRGEAFAYERHWRRLEKDAAVIRMPLPYTAAKVRVLVLARALMRRSRTRGQGTQRTSARSG